MVFERGGIDPTKFDPRAKHEKQYYTVGGKKDAFGNLDKESSLCQKMEKIPDFVSEETLLQYHAKNIGAIVDHSSKAHPEVAGEGVEYDWGFSKLAYHRHPLERKKKKEKFHELVNHCILRDSITIVHRSKFARRACQYNRAYHSLEKTNDKRTNDAPEISAALIEKLVKVYKRHHNILGQEEGFLNSHVK